MQMEVERCCTMYNYVFCLRIDNVGTDLFADVAHAAHLFHDDGPQLLRVNVLLTDRQADVIHVICGDLPHEHHLFVLLALTAGLGGASAVPVHRRASCDNRGVGLTAVRVRSWSVPWCDASLEWRRVRGERV